jgi:hypothetical protein
MRPQIDWTAWVTPEWVRAAVAEIARFAGDDEVAHGAEDDLHQRVLAAIAAGACERPAECAAEALKTGAIDFARWCA